MQTDLAVKLIILLPLVGALTNGLLGLFVPSFRARESMVALIGVAVVAVPFVVAVGLLLTLPHEAHVTSLYTWMSAGGLDIGFDYRIDQLSIIMTLIITGVGSLIHVYSIGYMKDDPGFWRFFAYLNLFIFAMLNLVLGNNLVVLFLGWEGVGLCSYLLIGFWYTERKNSRAANKAFIVNRIGDFAFLLAMFILFKSLGTLDFDGIIAGVPSLPASVASWSVLLLFLAATGKSAQIPLTQSPRRDRACRPARRHDREGMAELRHCQAICRPSGLTLVRKPSGAQSRRTRKRKAGLPFSDP